ncbi:MULTISPECIES: phage head closure protein [Helcococcus]|uniref:Phage head closure protein n=1 Tax=Helcococcus bovis TaxID=3153252 RepID=A0ABW9F655_9FIRM
MKISLLNEKIIIKKFEVVIDEIGNHTSNWTDYYTCFATISKESPLENTEAGNIWDSSKIDFTIRYTKILENLDSTKYRVYFKNNIYEIKGIDHMNFNKKSIKIHCQRIER